MANQQTKPKGSVMNEYEVAEIMSDTLDQMFSDIHNKADFDELRNHLVAIVVSEISTLKAKILELESVNKPT